MVSDLDSDEQFSIEEVWNSTLYFKELNTQIMNHSQIIVLIM